MRRWTGLKSTLASVGTEQQNFHPTLVPLSFQIIFLLLGFPLKHLGYWTSTWFWRKPPTSYSIVQKDGGSFPTFSYEAVDISPLLLNNNTTLTPLGKISPLWRISPTREPRENEKWRGIDLHVQPNLMVNPLSGAGHLVIGNLEVPTYSELGVRTTPEGCAKCDLEP